MASSSSSPACSRDGGKYVAVIRSALNRRFGGCYYWTHSHSTEGFNGGARHWSSGDTAMVFIPAAEASTVQALMDLSLPHFAGLGVGSQPVHAPWATSTDSPASPATSCPGTSGEENRGELASPCLDLDGLSSSDDDIGTSVGLDDLSVTLMCGSDEVFPPVNSDQALLDVDFPSEPVSHDRQQESVDVMPHRTFSWWMSLRYVGRGELDGPLHGFPRVSVCQGKFP